MDVAGVGGHYKHNQHNDDGHYSGIGGNYKHNQHDEYKHHHRHQSGG